MKRTMMFLAAALFLVLAALGCTGKGNPLNPNSQPDLTGATASGQSNSQTHLWGYYDIYVDIPTQTATAVVNRNAMFAANVVTFLNGNAANLQFKINGTPVDSKGKFVDVDIDVSIKHPFTGMSQYNGYDVRGIFLGNGSLTMKYGASNLKYAAYGSTDQVMYDYGLQTPDPHAGLAGMPDGYTRWFNPVEFTTPGLFGYTPGMFASSAYKPSSKLNPYKYFADDLTAAGDLPAFLKTTTKHGVFSAGTVNTRNYYLRFPLPNPGVKFAYAVVADWKGEAPSMHPANAEEAVAASVRVTPDVYFASSSNKGGKLKLDIDLFGHNYQPSSITIESTVLNNPYQLTGAEMDPVAGGSAFSTYHVEIPADNVTSTNGNEYFVIAQYDAFTYKSEMGVPNQTGTDKLAAFFRYDLFVANTPYNFVPVVNAIQDNIVGGGSYKDPVAITDTAVTYTALYTDPDPGESYSFKWWITADGFAPAPADVVTMPINWSTYAAGKYDIYVDVNDGLGTGHGGPFHITRNTLPVIDSGVSGNTNTKLAATDRYTVTAHDPDPGTTLSYAWTVTDVASSTKLLTDDPGNGNGTIDINWTAIGAAFGKKYEVSCKVQDGLGSSPATPLTVSINVLYSYDAATQDAGDLTVLYAADSAHSWTYSSSMKAWDDCNAATYPTGYSTTLGTPALNLPSGYSNIHLEISHWGNTEYEWDGGFIGYTTDNGATYKINGPASTYSAALFTFISGTNFNSDTNWYPPLYAPWIFPGWMQSLPSTGWTNKYFCGGYGDPPGAAWGSQASPVTSNFTCNSLAGKNSLKFAFNFFSDWSGTSTGWSIKAIKVYVDLP